MTHSRKMTYYANLNKRGLNTKQDIVTSFRNARPTKTKTPASKFTKMIGLSTVMQDAGGSTLLKHSQGFGNTEEIMEYQKDQIRRQNR